MNKIKNLINGFLKKKEVITIIGQYNVGKTSFVANIVKNLAIDNNKSVAIVCTEETKEKFLYRLLSLVTNIGILDLHKGTFDDTNKIKSARDKIKKAKIYISDSSNFTNYLSKIADKKIDLLIIDSLTYFVLEMDMSIYKIMEKLKEISKNLNCSILTTYKKLYSLPTYKEIVEKEEELIRKTSDTFIIMERDIVKLTIDSHADKTQTIDCKFNDSTGEFIDV